MRGVQSLFGDIPREMFDAMANSDAEAKEQHEIYKVRSAMHHSRREQDGQAELAEQELGH